MNADRGHSWLVTSGLNILLPALLGASSGEESLRSVYVFFRTLTPCTEPDFPGGIIWCFSEQSSVTQQQLASIKKYVQVHQGGKF